MNSQRFSEKQSFKKWSIRRVGCGAVRGDGSMKLNWKGDGETWAEARASRVIGGYFRIQQSGGELCYGHRPPIVYQVRWYESGGSGNTPWIGIGETFDEAKMLATANAVEYGLTASIWTNDLNTAHRAALAVQAGYVWINEVSKHFLGAPFGGFKQSGLGREECFEEMLSFTQEKNIHIRLKPSKT